MGPITEGRWFKPRSWYRHRPRYYRRPWPGKLDAIQSLSHHEPGRPCPGPRLTTTTETVLAAFADPSVLATTTTTPAVTLAQAVINNHRATDVLSGVFDTPTLDYVSRLIGDEGRTETSHTRDHHGSIGSSTEAVRHQPLASPAAFAKRESGQGARVRQPSVISAPLRAA